METKGNDYRILLAICGKTDRSGFRVEFYDEEAAKTALEVILVKQYKRGNIEPLRWLYDVLSIALADIDEEMTETFVDELKANVLGVREYIRKYTNSKLQKKEAL